MESTPSPASDGAPRSRLSLGTDDKAGMFAGAVLAAVVHAAVAGATLRLNHPEGNVNLAPTPRPEESQVIETHILQRGGGEYDPRHIPHRVTPVVAEREAPPVPQPTRDPTQVNLPRDAGAEDYMAAITGRRVTAHGNQDLAERLRMMAAAEQASDPTAVGPGAPSGSSVGDTTDPALATHGAATKIDLFLRQNIRVTTALTGSERTTVAFRIRLSATGTIDSATIVAPSGNPALDADILGQAEHLASDHAQIPDLTPEELAQVGGHNVTVNVPIAHLGGS